jgi:Domain of unknown function (DUF4333)
MKVLGDQLEAKISKASNNQPVDVTCPSKNILVAKGATFTCDVTVGASAAKIVFDCTNNDGTLEYKILDVNGAPVAAGGPASYHWETNPKTNMKLEVPAGWNKQVNGEVMVISTPTPGVGIEVVAASGGLESRADEKSMLAAVGKSLQNAKLTSALKPAQQHGLKGFVATGTGQKNGNPVQWFTAALGDGKGHAMLTLGFYSASTSPEYKTEMTHVLDSIQPAS